MAMHLPPPRANSLQRNSARLLPVPTAALKIPRRKILEGEPGSVYFSLVVPTYQESQNIEKVVAILSHLLDELLPHDYELIVVDDNSPDRTWEIALGLTESYPQLHVMRRQSERGLATAVIRGWQVARGEVLGVIDGDLQHPPEVLSQLLTTFAKDLIWQWLAAR